MNALITPVIQRLRDANKSQDVSVVERAFVAAELAHQGQLRKSGDPYITHPVAVAEILVEFGLDPHTIAAALLHDTVEDTNYSADKLRSDFGDEVANLVEGVTKLDRLTYGPTAEAETVRKMVVAMAKDIRVLVIKLADRLHNARTWQFVEPDSAARKARETLDIYAPLAHRLGMNAVKWELEDLSFKFLEPKKFEEIERLVIERNPSREKLTNDVIQVVEEDLATEGIAAQVTGRQKHLYSVYQKMIVRGRDLDEIYDLIGIRILVKNVGDCYSVLGRIHARWNPVPGRFKDYIAMPKFTMYQSLHTTVIGPHGRPVEFQIRTEEMHRQAEYGIAAHWRYKAGKDAKTPDDLSWLRQLLDWQREAEDPDEFLDSLRYDLASKEVYVFTPKGDVIALPVGSTPVDFAYSVHTDIGHRCVGARVNGKLVPLESQLSNGDVIEIFTSKAQDAAPNRDWLNFVASSRAKAKIKAWFSKERREGAEEVGRDAIVKGMRKQGLPLQRLMTPAIMNALAADLRYPDVTALYAAVGDNKISASFIIQRLLQSQGGVEGLLEDLSETITPTRVSKRKGLPQADPGVEVEGGADIMIKLARCCTPVPGDDIVGYVTRGHGVSVHRSDCSNVGAIASENQRFLKVTWAPRANSVFLVNIQIEAIDRARLLSDVTKALSDHHVNILSASVTTTRDRVALSRFTFEMSDPRHLGGILQSIKQIDGVYDCYRV